MQAIKRIKGFIVYGGFIDYVNLHTGLQNIFTSSVSYY